ncbi:hypothetical protein ACIPY5_01155 [Microbacterium sp. NPDC089698]|uniref:hypothetical protein n=1 Tax=Microbacterium sp. NPDC089698 TaxID=3364200 RepID=UPI0037FED0F8
MTCTRAVVLLAVGASAIVLAGAQTRRGPRRGLAWATIGVAAASCALFFADALLTMHRFLPFGSGLATPDADSWAGGIAWGARGIGAATLVGLVLILRARGGLPRWGLPLIVAILLSPLLHLVSIEILDGVAFFLLICTVGTAWRLQFEAEAAGAMDGA